MAYVSNEPRLRRVGWLGLLNPIFSQPISVDQFPTPLFYLTLGRRYGRAILPRLGSPTFLTGLSDTSPYERAG